jgi:hypothetical protein
MRRHSKGGGGCAVAAIAQPPTWTTYPTGTERALRLSSNPALAPSRPAVSHGPAT